MPAYTGSKLDQIVLSNLIFVPFIKKVSLLIAIEVPAPRISSILLDHHFKFANSDFPGLLLR